MTESRTAKIGFEFVKSVDSGSLCPFLWVKLKSNENANELTTKANDAHGVGYCFLTLGSAKWTVAIGPWIGYALLLTYFRNRRLWPGLGGTFLVLLISGLIGGYQVMPAPTPFFVVISLIISLKMVLPFLVDHATGAGKKGFWGSLIFPAAFVVLEYLDSFGDGGTWGSIANTQYAIKPLIQLASVFGIYGISFLVYWFASLFAWAFSLKFQWVRVKQGVLLASAIYLIAITFGVLRITVLQPANQTGVRMAGITLDNTNIMETSYRDAFDKEINLPLDMAQTSEEAAEAFAAMPPFIENAYSEQFARTRGAMEENMDELFRLSQLEVNKGARIVVWSEAIGLLLERDEEKFRELAGLFAKTNNTYLIAGIGLVIPGPMDGERLFMINKTLTFSTEGELINTYLKSNPVPFAEQDYGSDDLIPVLPTVYGNISPVICYDADFNHFMKQTGANQTDILVVPSGDWSAIAPYHSHMASFRGIENGCSVIRPVTRGTSLATDVYGNVLGISDFFKEDGKIITATVPTEGVDTVYNHIGDTLAYLCIAFLIFALGFKLFDFIKEYGNTNKLSEQMA